MGRSARTASAHELVRDENDIDDLRRQLDDVILRALGRTALREIWNLLENTLAGGARLSGEVTE